MQAQAHTALVKKNLSIILRHACYYLFHLELRKQGRHQIMPFARGLLFSIGLVRRKKRQESL